MIEKYNVIELKRTPELEKQAEADDTEQESIAYFRAADTAQSKKEDNTDKQ